MPDRSRRPHRSDLSFGPDADNEETVMIPRVTADEHTDEEDTTPEPGKPDWHAFFRPGLGQLAVAVALCVFAMAVVMQIRVTSEGEDYSGLRRSELIQVLDGLTQENRRLERDLGELDRAKERLESGADSQRVAREQAQARLSNLRVVAGTVPVAGPGIVLVIDDPEGKLGPELLVDAFQEMRDAGAEAMEVNGRIRVVGSTWAAWDDQGRLTIDGHPVSTPLTLRVIGEPHALEEGARFRGGIVSEITGPRVNGRVTIERSNSVSIVSVHEPRTFRYARTTE